jgi:hypothetical protein
MKIPSTIHLALIEEYTKENSEAIVEMSRLRQDHLVESI